MPTLTINGRASLAQSVKDKQATLMLAWGSGISAWDTDGLPEATDTTTALVAELGRRRCAVAEFVTPDAEGAIETRDGNYTLSLTPTTYLYLRFNFDYLDEATATIREVGLFMDATVVSGTPSGDVYLPVASIDDPGLLMVYEPLAKITRNDSVRQSFRFILPF